MRRTSTWAAGRPRLALGAWLALVAVLTVLGHGVGDHLQPTSTRIDGSASAAATALSAEHFADASTLPILLTGPSHDVRSQGRALAGRLAGLKNVRVLSPWNDATHRKLLRPSADHVLLLVSVRGSERSEQRAAVHVRSLARQVRAPVSVAVTGVPLVAQDLRSASIHAASRADLIALPLLLVLLLLVFRSFVAAAIPVAFGAATVLASGGIIRLLLEVVDLDAFATGLASMMGLALAVDYSLLIVSRYRDERAGGAEIDAAIQTATRTSTHAVAVAGAAVILAMGLAALLAAGQAVSSAAIGVGAAAILAMGGAALALPATLRLAGDRLDGTAVAKQRPSRWAGVAAAVLRRPAIAAAVTASGLLILAVPALSQSPSAPDVSQLPQSSSARADYETISAAVGPGWGAGFDIVAVARTGTMTTPHRLAALERFQRKLERDPGIAVVLGPGPLAKRAAKLRRSGRELLSGQQALQSAVPKQRDKLKQLDSKVGSASGGVKQLQSAFDQAASSASGLSKGGKTLKSGVGQLNSGLKSATAGARALDKSVSSATSNTATIAAGVHGSRLNAQQLARSLQAIGKGEAQVAPVVRKLQSHSQANRDTVREAVGAARSQRDDALASIATAKRALGSGKQTAQTLAALVALQKAQTRLQADALSGLADLAEGLDADATTAGRLADAVSAVSFHSLAVQARTLARLLVTADARQGTLDKAVAQLVASVGSLRSALEKLGGGTDALSGGLAQLDAGLSRLQSGATAGKARTQALAEGLAGARGALAGVQNTGAGGPKGAAHDSSAQNAINSGYFVLAVLDAQGRGGETTGLDVDRGGQAARIIVIPRTGPNDPRTRALASRLDAATEQLSAATKTDTAVGGPAAVLADYQHATSQRLLTIVLALALATALLLAIVLRSPAVAVLGVALNLLAVGATLGVLDHLYTGDDPLLGGPGALDATALTAVFAVMFALATDYQVFVVTRIREELMAGGDPRAAVAAGVARTARVVTGAALSMVAVFLAFGTADVASLEQFGVGLTVAVILDATIIRLILLPSVLTLGGRYTWWPGTPTRPGVPSSPGAL